MTIATKSLLSISLLLGGCVAIDDFSMFYVPDGSVDGGTDTGMTDTSTTDSSTDAPIDGCTPVAETCNSVDDDCDGTVDEEPTECSVPNGSVTCMSDMCVLLACDAGWESCGGEDCDTDVRADRYHCGACGDICDLGADCVSSVCTASDVLWTTIADSPVTAFTTAVDFRDDLVVFGGLYREELEVDGISVTGSATENRIYAAQLNESGEPEWVVTSDAGDFNTVQTAAIAPSGEIYVTGEVADLLTIDGRNVTTPASTRSVYLWILTNRGVTTGLEILEATGGQVRSVDSGVSSDGTLYIAGWFTGTVTFGTASAASAGAKDMFIAKRTTAGVTSLFTFGSGGDEGIYAMDVDPAGGVVISADYENVITMGSTTLPAPVGSVDSIVAAIDATGGVRWVHTAGSPRLEWSQGVAIDEDRNVYFMGAFPHEVDGSGGLSAASFDTTGIVGAEVVICSFDSTGSLRWAHPTEIGESYWTTVMGSPALRHSFGHASASGGRLYVAVDIISGLAIDERSVTSATLSSSVGVFAFDAANGSFDWAHTFGATNDFGAFDLAADPTSVAVAGRFRETATIGADTYTSPTGAWSGYVTRIVSP